MKRVYLYVGEHQRLQGTVQKLPRVLAVVRKRARVGEGAGEREGTGAEAGELEVVEVVKWKAVFSQRPEPVGS
jgi:chromosome transmission fidelity protein 8